MTAEGERDALRRVCVIGAGTIGSLLAGHLGQVCEVSLLVRRPEQAQSLERDGLRISGKRELLTRVQAVTDPAELPPFELGILAVKATDLAVVCEGLRDVSPGATMMTIQNGLGAEEVVAHHGDWPLISAVTFMSGNRRSDRHVEYELDTATWLGPWAATATSPQTVAAAAALINSSGLKAETLPDLLPAQWSKLIFNSAINGVAALTELPHVSSYAELEGPVALGPLVSELINEGKRVASASGVELYEDPWEMNQLAVARGETGASEYAHLPSMLEDVLAHRRTEIDFIAGALIREAHKHSVEVPFTDAMYRMIKGKETSWSPSRSHPEEVRT